MLSKIRIALALSTATLALILTGCGGGGGGGSTGGPKPATLTGIVDVTAGTPASGYTVRFGSFATVTDTSGQFSIDFDASQLSGAQSLKIYDLSNSLIDVETVNVNSAGGTQNAGAIIVGPPAPPV